jgi:hypothetical protein
MHWFNMIGFLINLCMFENAMWLWMSYSSFSSLLAFLLACVEKVVGILGVNIILLKLL